MLPSVPLALLKLWMMSYRLTGRAKPAVFSVSSNMLT